MKPTPMNGDKHRDDPREASALASALVPLLAASSVTSAQSVSVSPKVETVPVPTAGDAADDVAIWVHPTQPELSLLIGTDKDSGIAVYDLGGRELQFLPDGRLNNVDIRYRFPLAGNEVPLLTAGKREENVLAAYTVDPSARTLRDVSARAIALGFDIYGSCMYRSRVTGDTYFFGTSEDGIVQQWRLFDGGAGRVDAEMVRTFDVGGQTEGCVADDEDAWLFLGEENVGIWRYGAEPSAGDARLLVDSTASGHLKADVEGLALYYASAGCGYLIASSQGNSSFVVYERRPPHKHRLTFVIGANRDLDIDEVTRTDGIDLINLGLGSPFPGGLFVAQDSSNPGGNQNFKVVDWQDIAMAATPPLVIDPLYDAYGALGGLGLRKR